MVPDRSRARSDGALRLLPAAGEEGRASRWIRWRDSTSPTAPRLERLNWGADTSASGLANSFGLMVNYVYGLSELERNHEAYAQHSRLVASRELEKLSQQTLFTDRRRTG